MLQEFVVGIPIGRNDSRQIMGIKWKHIYWTGNTRLDAQHREWFIKVEHLFDATSGPARLIAARKLWRYSRLHFLSEARVMQELRYPDAKQHTRGHAATMIHLNLLIQQVLDDTFDQVKWRAFFADLFIRHIADEDIKLERFLFDRMRAAEWTAESMARQYYRPSGRGELSQRSHRLGGPSKPMGLKH